MVAVTIVFVLYFLFLTALLIGWGRTAGRQTTASEAKDQLISVVIPVRNEEETIAKLLRTIATQDYRNFEIVVVNDDCEDETLWMVSQVGMPNLRVIHSPGKGKKAAITAGVRAARGTIIVTTDADCMVSSQWLRQIRESFRDREVMMAFGGVRIEQSDSFFKTLQSMEFASLIGAGAATASLGFPTMCNGANLSFRKKAFLDVKGYEGNLNIPSGDDEFLMRKIERRYPGSVRFIHSQKAVVTTIAQQNPPAFFNQRIRWASKWKHNTSWFARTLAVAVALTQAGFIANWFFLASPSVIQALFLLSIKLILEAALLLQVCRFLRIKWSWPAFFSLQILYPLYVIGVAIGSFFQPFEWKRRVFKPV